MIYTLYREHLYRDAQKLLLSSHNNSHNSRTISTEERPLEKRICTAITAGFYMNSAVLCAHGSVFKYLSLLDQERQRNRQEALDVRMVHIHPTSSLSNEGSDCPHSTVVYQALAHGNKLYMKQVGRADSKLLRQLQRDWVYVDPYVLCGRQAERSQQQQKQGGSEHSTLHSSTTSTSSSGITDAERGGAKQCSNTAISSSTTTSTNASVGIKRSLPLETSTATTTPINTSASAVGTTISTTTTTSNTTAAEAAKQRYLERMAQQKKLRK